MAYTIKPLEPGDVQHLQTDASDPSTRIGIKGRVVVVCDGEELPLHFQVDGDEYAEHMAGRHGQTLFNAGFALMAPKVDELIAEWRAQKASGAVEVPASAESLHGIAT